MFLEYFDSILWRNIANIFIAKHSGHPFGAVSHAKCRFQINLVLKSIFFHQFLESTNYIIRTLQMTRAANTNLYVHTTLTFLPGTGQSY